MSLSAVIPADWEVPQKFRDRLGKKVGRQRAMIADGHLLLVLHAPPKPGDRERTGRVFWRTPEGDWTSNTLGKGISSLGRHLTEYADLLGKLDQQEEEAVSAEELFEVLEPLAPVQRAATNLHLALQEARTRLPDDHDMINMRDRAYEIERTADLLYADVKNALDLAVARRAEDQARSSLQMAVASHRLNVLAAFFFPIMTLSTVFGANLNHGWEEKLVPIPFLAMLTTGVVCGTILLATLRARDMKRQQQ